MSLKNISIVILILTFCNTIFSYPYALRREMKTYYIDDIWSEEMFIEPVKAFVQDEFARYGYRHTPYKDDADVRIHITIHSVKNKPDNIKPFLIWPVTGHQRNVGEARISARIIDNETNKEVWANSIKGRSIQSLILGWTSRPRKARMRAFYKSMGLVFDPFFVHDMPLFD